MENKNSLQQENAITSSAILEENLSSSKSSEFETITAPIFKENLLDGNRRDHPILFFHLELLTRFHVHQEGSLQQLMVL